MFRLFIYLLSIISLFSRIPTYDEIVGFDDDEVQLNSLRPNISMYILHTVLYTLF